MRHSRTITKILCFLPQWFLHRLAELRWFLYRHGFFYRGQLPGRVISVGNLAWGGTGKTPVVKLILQHLLAAGHRPAVLTRGYGAQMSARQSCVVKNGEIILARFSSEKKLFPDEALEVSAEFASVPIIVGAHRLESARWYLSQEQHPPSHWILDDGMQHHRIMRDVDLCLVDLDFYKGMNSFDFLTRESKTALNRVGAIIVTKGSSGTATHTYKGKNVYSAVFDQGTPRCPRGQGTFKVDQPTTLILGIARPKDLEDHLEKNGFKMIRKIIVKDHQPVPEADIKQAFANGGQVITTAKDYYRQKNSYAPYIGQIFLVPLELKISPAFFKII